jgi:hypothetical protein
LFHGQLGGLAMTQMGLFSSRNAPGLLIGCDDGQLRKIRAIARGIPCDQLIAGNGRVGTDKKIRQRGPLCAPALSLSQKRLAGQKCSVVRQGFPLDHRFRQCRVEILNARVTNRDRGINDGIDNQPEAIRQPFDDFGGPSRIAVIRRRGSMP